MNRNAHFDYFNPLFLLFFFSIFSSLTIFVSPSLPSRTLLSYVSFTLTFSFSFLSSQRNHSVFEGSSLVWTCYGITPKEVNDLSTAFLSLYLSVSIFFPTSSSQSDNRVKSSQNNTQRKREIKEETHDSKYILAYSLLYTVHFNKDQSETRWNNTKSLSGKK